MDNLKEAGHKRNVSKRSYTTAEMYEYRVTRPHSASLKSPVELDPEKSDLQPLFTEQNIDYDADRIKNDLVKEIFDEAPNAAKKPKTENGSLYNKSLHQESKQGTSDDNKHFDYPNLNGVFDKPDNKHNVKLESIPEGLNYYGSYPKFPPQNYPTGPASNAPPQRFGEITPNVRDILNTNSHLHNPSFHNFSHSRDQGYYSVSSANSYNEKSCRNSIARSGGMDNSYRNFVHSTPKILPARNEFMFDDVLSLPIGETASDLVSNLRNQYPKLERQPQQNFCDLDVATKMNKKHQNTIPPNNLNFGPPFLKPDLGLYKNYNSPKNCQPPNEPNLTPINRDQSGSINRSSIDLLPKMPPNLPPSLPNYDKLNFPHFRPEMNLHDFPQKTQHFHKMTEKLDDCQMSLPDMYQQEKLQSDIDSNFKPSGPMSFIYKVPSGIKYSSFIEKVYLSGSAVYAVHPISQLIRDLKECDNQFWTSSFPYRLVLNLPVDFQHLLFNFKRTHYYLFVNFKGDDTVSDELTEVARYLHNSILMKLQLRNDSALQNMYNHGRVAADDVCNRFSRVVQNGGFKRGPDDSFFNGGNSRRPDNPSTSLQRRDKKKHMALPKEAIEIMLSWLREHKGNPYPNEIEKRMLVQATQISMSQLNYWFTNARRRILPKWALAQKQKSQERS